MSVSNRFIVTKTFLIQKSGYPKFTERLFHKHVMQDVWLKNDITKYDVLIIRQTSYSHVGVLECEEVIEDTLVIRIEDRITA
jgi:hypothetical protein